MDNIQKEKQMNEETKLVPEEKAKDVTKKDVEAQEKISQEEAMKILTQLNGVVLKLGKGLFKICYINEGKIRFSAELINLEK